MSVIIKLFLSKTKKMRAFIAALLAASAYAAGGSIGSYDYVKGGDDWHIKYRGDSNVCGTGKE